MNLPDPNALIDALAAQLAPTLSPDCALIGIHTGGVWLRDAVVARLPLMSPMPVLGELDVSFYRDDYAQSGLHAEVQPSVIPFEIEGRHVVLFDDVLYTGRTVRAALNLLFDYGRPASIRLAVLVDRGGRELPIGADFVGLKLDLPATEHIDLLRDATGALRFVHGPWE
ncbi:MAG: bifunctional pyr operon transcriptional regulator/uracil phosphoribosyltransferase PyrR [Betaproteobacteria bacterium]|nr:MAG: bifunctional pyr operon transcriptional regulator/uracil phosphoribosyltransferase PyrR [Betaproteobacteria bacterium]